MNAHPVPDHFVAGMAPLRMDFANLIDGEMVCGKEWFDVLNPATGQAFARAPLLSREELDRAVAAARRAFPAWRATAVADRRAAIGRMAQTLTDNAAALAELLTLEQGKPVGQSRDEISRAAAQSIGMAQIVIADEVLEDNAQRRIELKYFPLGVVGIITPWNAPINLAAGPLVAALYTGNTLILKPSPYTPLCTLKLGELLRDAFPPGVLNILAGGDELGRWVTEAPGIDKISFTGSVGPGQKGSDSAAGEPGIDKISFTGSVATAKKVMASAAGTLKRVTLELGGNDAAIVLDDVDI